MSKTEVKPQREAMAYIKPGQLEVGEPLVVRYEGRTTIKDGYDKYNFLARLEDGSRVTINTCKALEERLPSIPVGSLIEIVLTGKEKKKNKEGKAYNELIMQVFIISGPEAAQAEAVGADEEIPF